MSAIRKTVHISAAPDQVYGALTRPDGYRGWWCANSAIADWEGGESLLHFRKDGTPVSMRFRVDALEPRTRIAWTCVDNDAPPWVGTTLSWALRPSGEGVAVELEHGGWDDDAPAEVAMGWEHFLASLKAYVEGGEGQPW